MSDRDDLTDRHSDRIATTQARLEGLAAAQTRLRRDGRRRVMRHFQAERQTVKAEEDTIHELAQPGNPTASSPSAGTSS
jgi:hypothetical protein